MAVALKCDHLGARSTAKRSYVITCVLLAACWTSPPIVEPHETKPRVHKRARVECWSPEFHEQWPRETALYEIIGRCDEMWPGDQAVSDSCVYMETWRAYQELLNWTGRWFEACSSPTR